MKKTAVLVHGYTMKAYSVPGNRNWEYVVFGNENKKGRVPKGLELAKKFSAEMIIFGTGASCRFGTKVYSRKEYYELLNGEKPRNGFFEWEAEFTHRYALNHPHYGGIMRKMRKRINFELECDSVNTFEEIKNSLELCRENEIERLFLVTNPSHLPRCILNANKLKNFDIDIFGIACDTDFADGGETFIAEPFSGGGEKPELNLNQILPGIFKINPQNMPSFLKDLKTMIEENIKK